MAVASSLHTMPSSSSISAFLLPKTNLSMGDSQVIDTLLHGQTHESKIQIVNHWCQNTRRNRLSAILDVSQRHDVLLALVNTLQQTTNTEYQYNCLTLLSELQGNISHYDQETYLPAIIRCFSSTSTDVQLLTCDVLIKQIRCTADVSTFLHIYTHEGLKSANTRICLKSIETLTDLISHGHQHENLSPIFELLLHFCNDQQFRLNYHPVLLRALRHLKRLVNPELLSSYLETYPMALRRVYHSYVLPQIESNEDTPRAALPVSQLLEKSSYSFRAPGDVSHSTSKSTIAPFSFETTDIPALIEQIRSNWSAFDENDRSTHLNRLKTACEKYHQTILSQNSPSTTARDKQAQQLLLPCLTSLLDLLHTISLVDAELSVKTKLIVSSCLAWLVKYGQVSFCRKHVRKICTTFKNTLLNGEANNRQLAKFGVSLILLLGNFVHPQLILQELIDGRFITYNYRIQLEILAISTATLIKYRQHRYEALPRLYPHLLSLLVSDRRELRHGAMECFTAICAQLNAYQPLTIKTMESNASIQVLLAGVDHLSYEASHALRFRLQRNLLPALTEEGNITPGLVCSAHPASDADVRYILSVNKNSVSTPQSVRSSELGAIEPPLVPAKMPTNNSKLLQMAMPFATKKSNSNEEIMRSREIPPLKPPDLDLTNNNNHHHRYETSINPNIPSGGSLVDLTVTGNSNYRPLTLTEKIFTDEWSKKLSSKTQTRKESNPLSEQQENNHPNHTLQFRPSIPRRPSPGRLPASHNLLLTSQIHNHQETKLPTHFTEHEERIDHAINSRSGDPSNPETNPSSKKPVQTSTTRRHAAELEGSSVSTLTPEHSNESGIFSQSSRESNITAKPVGKQALFSTRPRLARSSQKPKVERVSFPASDSSAPHLNDQRSHVEVIGRGYAEEKTVARRFSSGNIDEKQPVGHPKPKAKIIKGSVVTNPANTVAHANAPFDDESIFDDEQDIGVIGKAVHIPLRSKGDLDGGRLQNNPSMTNLFNRPDDALDIVSDEFDSDSKENENHPDMNQSLSASFRLRVQQKTQEKIEQKERRRQDREIRHREEQLVNTTEDTPASSTSTSRYSSQPDLTSLGNERPPTPKRPIELNNTSILPSFPSQQRLRVSKNSMARSQTFNHRVDLSTNDQRVAFHRPLSEDRISDQLRNPQNAYREAMESIASDDWEQKCSGLNLLQVLLSKYPDPITQNLHQVVLVLINEVKNLRSQVARYALSAFTDLFKYLQRNMDIELDITVKALIQKSSDTNDFFKSDTEKCLQTMIDNVTLQKALQALIAGGASHRNPAARKTTAKYIYLVCEKLGPAKILNGTREITERVLQVAATFASDGPPEIRWYGKKIYHLLLSHDELDSMMRHYLSAPVYTHMCEILDTIRTKGGVGETPSESARNNVRRTLSNDRLGPSGSLTNQFPSTRKINTADQVEQVRDISKQLRNTDFRERINGIEEFQKLCELETETAIQALVQIFDGFNECLSHMNSKVVLKALNTMHQVVPILGDNLSPVINSALPLIAQNIASNNREIAQLASDIIDAAIEYIDCGVLIQPLCLLSQNSNLRVRPEVLLKLAILVPQVCQRKPKQVEIHLLPTYWKILSLLRGQHSTAISSSAGGSNSLNSSIHTLTRALYTELGDTLLDRASCSSAVTPANLQLLRELCANIQAV